MTNTMIKTWTQLGTHLVHTLYLSILRSIISFIYTLSCKKKINYLDFLLQSDSSPQDFLHILISQREVFGQCIDSSDHIRVSALKKLPAKLTIRMPSVSNCWHITNLRRNQD